MFKVLKYSFYDLSRSRWIYLYFAFFLLTGFGLLYLSNDLPKAIVSLMNILVTLCPLVGIIFGSLYYYNSREFVELLLGLPLRRKSIFLGKYLGLSTSLSLSFLVGTGIPFLFYGIMVSGRVWDFVILLFVGVVLTFIFSALAFLIATASNNSIRGFSFALVVWLLLAFIYDGIFLLSLLVFDQYPLDSYALLVTFLNPIDLSRVLIMLKLDLSAMMGYTGAVFHKFLGTNLGMILSILSLLAWTVIPLWIFTRVASKKDF